MSNKVEADETVAAIKALGRKAVMCGSGTRGNAACSDSRHRASRGAGRYRSDSWDYVINNAGVRHSFFLCGNE